MCCSQMNLIKDLQAIFGLSINTMISTVKEVTIHLKWTFQFQEDSMFEYFPFFAAGVSSSPMT